MLYPTLVKRAASKLKTLAILGYHKVGEPPPDGWETWYYVSTRTFLRQLEYLRENDWRVIDTATLLAGLDAPENLPERTALITFDDGYRSIREIALPCLREFGYPGVVFVPTDFVGATNSFDAGEEPDEAICSWDDLRELERRGISVQSHGVSHREFSKLNADEIVMELVQSKAVLEAGLGKVIDLFAFPYGDAGVDPKLTAQLLERAGYRAACLYGGGPNAWPIGDRFSLTRLAMGPDTDLAAELGDSWE